MTAGTTRRLLSIDLLDEDEHAHLDGATRTALSVLTTSNRSGPISGRKVCKRGWRATLLIAKPCGSGESDGA